MVKSAEEIATVRAAQRAALKARMAAGRQNRPPVEALPELPPLNLPPIEPLPALPQSPTDSHKSTNSLDLLDWAAEPSLDRRSRTSSAKGKEKAEFFKEGDDSDDSISLPQFRGELSENIEPGDSDLDLEESIDEAAERSGIISISDLEDDDRLVVRMPRQNSGIIDLLAASSSSLVNQNKPVAYTSSDEEEFDLSLDTSCDPSSSSRLSMTSAASSHSSILSTSLANSNHTSKIRNQFPSPRTKSGAFLSPPLATTRRQSLGSVTSGKTSPSSSASYQTASSNTSRASKLPARHSLPASKTIVPSKIGRPSSTTAPRSRPSDGQAMTAGRARRKPSISSSASSRDSPVPVSSAPTSPKIGSLVRSGLPRPSSALDRDSTRISRIAVPRNRASVPASR